MKQLLILLSLSIGLMSCTSSETVKDINIITSDDVIISENEDIVEEISVEEEPEESSALDLSTAVFSGNGTEPFWGFNASGSTVVLREPSDTGPMDITTYTGVIMTNIGTSVNMTTGGMSLDLVLGTCSDGMSDIVYDYSSTFIDGALSYSGCANVD